MNGGGINEPLTTYASALQPTFAQVSADLLGAAIQHFRRFRNTQRVLMCGGMIHSRKCLRLRCVQQHDGRKYTANRERGRTMSQRLSDDLILIDLGFQDQHHAIAAWLVRGDDRWIVIDCGPTTTNRNLVEGIQASGLEMGDISYIVLTHIHLDHGGGAGALMQDYPHLRAVIQTDAAQFLIDPTRLLRSASMSFGDRMERLWGEVVGIDPSRVDGIVTGDNLPGTRLRAYATPGHTATHLSFLDPDSGILFAGDAAHARLPESALIIPTLAPVELDFDAWHTTARTMQSLAPSALAIPHFGFVADASEHLAQVEDRINERRALAEQLVRTPEDLDALIALYERTTRAEYTEEGGDVDDKVLSLGLAMPGYLGGQGMMRWFKVHGWFEP